MKTLLFVTKPKYHPERVKASRDTEWSCSRNTDAGDRAMVYVTGRGISYEWRVTSDAERTREMEWPYCCQVEYVRTFKPPINLAELCAAISKKEWNAPHQNMRVKSTTIIPNRVAERVRGFRLRSFRELEQEFIGKVAASGKLLPRQRRERLSTAEKYPTMVKITTTVYLRNPDVVAEVLFRAMGRCESCRRPAPFLRAADESPYLETHHPVRLADGGEDTVENALALCPNCHRKAHYG